MRHAPGVSAGTSSGIDRQLHRHGLPGLQALQQSAVDDRAGQNLDAGILDIAADASLGLKHQMLIGNDASADLAVDDEAGDFDVTIDAAFRTDDERAGLAVAIADAAPDFSVDTQFAGKMDVAGNDGSGAEYAIDARGGVRDWLGTATAAHLGRAIRDSGRFLFRERQKTGIACYRKTLDGRHLIHAFDLGSSIKLASRP